MTRCYVQAAAAVTLAIAMLAVARGLAAADEPAEATGAHLFNTRVAAIFEHRCVTCHNDHAHKGGLSLETAAGLATGSDKGPVVAPGKPDRSKMMAMIGGEPGGGGKPKMPKKGGPLTDAEVESIRAWIAAGAVFPADRRLEDKYTADADLWSLRPIANPPAPQLAGADATWARNQIDRFTLAMMRKKGLTPAPEADRRTLIRRLYFDLIGLPPSPEEVDAFAADADPYAYEKLVDTLLASPGYGERWARHWLDAVHYGDTHGYDKDKVRPNAWPYRDYVIRAFNEDKPYDRFVKEQLAGDVFYPGEPDGVLGLGFIAAGPFDWVGHIELGENQPDKAVVRNIDRDDMVATTMNTFVSLTAQCARCHNHKFDPITQEDYYSLQAVFAAVDRADRPYDLDPKVADRRMELERKREQMVAYRRRVERDAMQQVRQQLTPLDAQIAKLDKPTGERPEFGYHSQIEAKQDAVKWVQLDLGKTRPIGTIVYVGCHDPYAGIGAGFGFPVRYRIEISDDATFTTGVTVVADFTKADAANPGVTPQTADAPGPGAKPARFVRITATKLAERTKDYIFALAEVTVLSPDGAAISDKAEVTSLDSIEAPPRWRMVNLIDGYYYGRGGEASAAQLAELRDRRQKLVDDAIAPGDLAKIREDAPKLAEIDRELRSLPSSRGVVYAAATAFGPQGNFKPTGGKPRPIYRLIRGSEKNPDMQLGEMKPGAISALSNLAHHFDLPADADESARRTALAEWIVDKDNPLTWRSIVNRIWQHHFSAGLVDSPNDFGHMGEQPSHPELLDRLATWFRDGDRSIKQLHRLICNSATYRQAVVDNPANDAIDGSNQFLWRQNRRKLEAEAIRDTTLLVAGALDRKMGGPGFRVFGFKDDHSPHYLYSEYDPNDASTHRRAIYRLVVRSVPDPFMETLDCADPSQVTPKRIQTLTALQALALMNNRFMIAMAQRFADRVESMGDTPARRIDAAYRLALGRHATDAELATLEPIAAKHGLANACRIILNSNEFIFVD